MLNLCEPHRPLYVDENNKKGDDNNPQYGLERSTLAFYAGDGYDIEGWYVPNPYMDDWVPLDLVRVGDQSLRYFWLYSCSVLAHGPKRILGKPNHSAPQCFRPDMGHADVFVNWATGFAPNMRMVCGGSTNLGHTGVGEIWSYLLDSETSVADAWILGLDHPKEVSVCLARGGQDPVSSALADRTLHSEGVTQRGSLHFQHAVKCNAKPIGSTLRVRCNKPTICSRLGEPSTSEPGPAALTEVREVPLVTTTPRKAPRLKGESLPLGFVRLVEYDNWKYHPNSGGVVFVKNRKSFDRYIQLKRCDEETEWTISPSALLRQSGLNLSILGIDSASSSRGLADFSITAREMRVESRVDGKLKGPCSVRSLFLLLHSRVDVGPESHPESYPVFGPAIALELQRRGNEVPVLASFSAPRRELTVQPKTVGIRPAVDVITEAHEALQLKAGEYPVGSAQAILGYEEAPLRCLQKYLRPTYEIQFFPTPEAAQNRPIVTVRREAVRRDEGLDLPDFSWKCERWGEFPPP